jgi:hypothetical protein
VSEDGLTIYFLAQVTANGAFDFDIYSASRASTSDGFGVATAVLNVNVAGQQARYPELSEDGLELYFSGNDFGPIMVATRSNVSSAFGVPTAVRAGVASNFASISGNKLALYYLSPVSTPNNMANGLVMQTTRAAVGGLQEAALALDQSRCFACRSYRSRVGLQEATLDQAQSPVTQQECQFTDR